ncbi:MAG: hypothetical protein Kow0069_01500 [Promethearchaeota archaeon]
MGLLSASPLVVAMGTPRLGDSHAYGGNGAGGGGPSSFSSPRGGLGSGSGGLHGFVNFCGSKATGAATNGSNASDTPERRPSNRKAIIATKEVGREHALVTPFAKTFALGRAPRKVPPEETTRQRGGLAKFSRKSPFPLWTGPRQVSTNQADRRPERGPQLPRSVPIP